MALITAVTVHSAPALAKTGPPEFPGRTGQSRRNSDAAKRPSQVKDALSMCGRRLE